MINIIVMSRNNLRDNQKGIMSIIVALVFIMILGLIVVSFGLASRSQNKQTVDNQLSTASYYAAQSGINEILKQISSNSYIADSTTCQTSTISALIFTNNNSKITCIKVTESTASLLYNNVDTSVSQISNISSLYTTAAVPALYLGAYDLTITWNNHDDTSSNTACPIALSRQSISAWKSSGCGAGILKLDLSVDPSQANSRNLLNSYSENVFLYPTKTAGLRSTDYRNTGNPAPVSVLGSPSGLRDETATIHCSNANSSPFLLGALLPCTWLNLRSLYASQDVTITASTPGGSALAFKDSQISIDVTAVTSNVARRVVETASVFTQVPNNTSNFALQTESTICKLLQVRDSKGNITSAADFGPPPTPTPSCSFSY